MGNIIKKEVCECKNCGNEAEMVVTCSLPDIDEKQEESTAASVPSTDPLPEKRVKGTATCTQCGNESDMWIDL